MDAMYNELDVFLKASYEHAGFKIENEELWPFSEVRENGSDIFENCVYDAQFTYSFVCNGEYVMLLGTAGFDKDKHLILYPEDDGASILVDYFIISEDYDGEISLENTYTQFPADCKYTLEYFYFEDYPEEDAEEEGGVGEDDDTVSSVDI